MSKSLDEFIEGRLKEETASIQIWVDGEMKATINEAIRVCEEWCGMDAYEHGYDKLTDEHTCDDARGRQCSADELLNKLKSWAGDHGK